MYRDFLLPQLTAGKIKSIERQYKFELQEGFRTPDGKRVLPINYIADFFVEFACGQKIVFDFKGWPDEVSKIKRKLFLYKYDYPLYWVTYSKIDGGYVPFELVQKNRKARRKARENKE